MIDGPAPERLRQEGGVARLVPRLGRETTEGLEPRGNRIEVVVACGGESSRAELEGAARITLVAVRDRERLVEKRGPLRGLRFRLRSDLEHLQELAEGRLCAVHGLEQARCRESRFGRRK